MCLSGELPSATPMHVVRLRMRTVRKVYYGALPSVRVLTPDEISIYQLKIEIINRGWLSLLSAAESHPFQCYILAVAANPDSAKEAGPQDQWHCSQQLVKGAFGTTCSCNTDVSQLTHSLWQSMPWLLLFSWNWATLRLLPHKPYEYPDHSWALCELMQELYWWYFHL